MCETAEQKMAQRASKLAPVLTPDKRKGEAGIIGVFGGTTSGYMDGAPYFSSYSALKVGADLAYVFCKKESIHIIQSFSPDLLVLPLLDESIEDIEPWLDRVNVVVVGAGLGKQKETLSLIENVINSCRVKKKPLVIDADGLCLIKSKPELLKNYPEAVVLTPNVSEFCCLIGITNTCMGECSEGGSKLERSKSYQTNLGPNIIILCKDSEDDIITNGKVMKITSGGSARRCGSQGDFLSGVLSTFLYWAILKHEEPAVACYAAARLTRECSERAFAKYGRSMTTSYMIQEIHGVFKDYFELA